MKGARMAERNCKCCGTLSQTTRGLCSRCSSGDTPFSWYFTFGGRLRPEEKKEEEQK